MKSNFSVRPGGQKQRRKVICPGRESRAGTGGKVFNQLENVNFADNTLPTVA